MPPIEGLQKTAEDSLANPEVRKQLGERIFTQFKAGVEFFKATLAETRTLQPKEKDTKKRVAVVVSLWEEDGNLLSSKMFKKTYDALIKQAKDSECLLDVIIVANNGGGKTPELGAEMRRSLLEHLNLSEGSSNYLKLQEPIGVTAAEPIDFELPFGDATGSKGNRLVFVEQPFDDRNKGKIKAVRDVSNALGNAFIKGYAPDAILQIDAESILSLDLGVTEEPIAPLKVMLNNLFRGNKIAVGTKDNFKIMDPSTGEATDTILGAPPLGFMEANKDKFISLPGGALLCRPEYYVAGMMAMSQNLPSLGVEDYMFTKLLWKLADEDGKDIEELVKSLGIVRHLNRTPQRLDKQVRQLALWRKHAQGVDALISEHPYNNEPFIKFVGLVVRSRIESSIKGRDPAQAVALLKDAALLKDILIEIFGSVSELDVQELLEGMTQGKPFTWTTEQAVESK